MTQREFIEKYRYELLGFVYEATLGGRTGSLAAKWMEQIAHRIDGQLALAFADAGGVLPTKLLAGSETAASGASSPATGTNGQPTSPTVAVRSGQPDQKSGGQGTAETTPLKQGSDRKTGGSIPNAGPSTLPMGRPTGTGQGTR